MSWYDLCACGERKTSVSKRCWTCHASKTPPTLCASCGKEISPTALRCRECAALHRRQPRLHPSGYLQVVDHGHPLADNRGRVLLHRKVVFDAGIPVPEGHAVHHVNGDRLDNRLENLRVLPSSEHSRLHAWDRGWVRNQFGVFPVQEHSLSAYRRGCRCDVCRKANTDYCREQGRKRRARAHA